MGEEKIYPHHPAAALFPMMKPIAFKRFADGIRADGLKAPIRLHEGMILDGRNRDAACRETGVKARYEPAELGNQSPIQFVLSMNKDRSEFTKSQKAAIAVDLIPHLKPGADKAREEGQKAGGRGRKKNFSPEMDPSFDCAEIAAKIMNIARGYVTSALTVKKADAMLFERVKRGEVNVSRAYDLVKGSPARRVVTKATKPSAKRVAAYQAEAEAWRQQLCKELRARRVAIEGKALSGRRWNPENIAKLELLKLLDWIETELYSPFTGQSVNGRGDAESTNQPAEMENQEIA
jgi:hypothetical protein